MKSLLKSYGDIITAVLILLIVTVLSLAGLFKRYEYRAYDAMLGLTAEIQERPEIVLVEVDDPSISTIGDWPWPRNVLGDALIRMKELGAAKAVFDIEYLSPSSKAVSSKNQAEKERIFEEERAAINEVVLELSQAFASGQVKKNGIKALTEEMVQEYINPSIDKMKNSTEALVFDNDEYLARCVKVFGDAWLTINTRDVGIIRTPEEIQFAKDRFLSAPERVIDKQELIPQGNIAKVREEEKENSVSIKRGFTPALDIIMQGAAGAGFTNSIVDGDGTRRRIELLSEYDGKYLLQLAFSPLSNALDVEKIIRSNGSLMLKGALLPGKDERCDIKIPLDRNGCMLINWVQKQYGLSFKGQHESVQFLYLLDKIEENISNCIQSINGTYIPDAEGNAMEYSIKADYMVRLYEYVLQAREAVLNGNASFDEYMEMHDEFIKCAGEFIEAGYLDNVLQTLSLYDDGSNPEYFVQIADMLKNCWSVLEQEYTTYCSYVEEMKSVYNGAICFIGFTATASTDFGVTPFDKTYANLGVHANVANTILCQNFITPVKEYNGLSAGYLFTALFALLIVCLIHKKAPARRNLYGVLYALIPTSTVISLMAFSQIYVPLVSILLFSIFLYAGELAYNFISVEGDKKFLQNTFGAYVAPEVVKEIVKNPDVAKLGGKSEYITALFSDVATFSGFTEVINNEEMRRAREANAALPVSEQKSNDEVELIGASRGAERLVQILNAYLGVLSDAIMDNGGTIDKYVGDEIVSFFGAPVPDKNNAFHGCVAGIRMLQAEKKYNDEQSHNLPVNPQTGKPFLLHSRVGLNTGNMVVGNMGTDKKLNYTIMGNHVNLASRLEGTNKAYGSWMMVSESTWQSADSGENKGKLVARKLDCVRVINVKKPVGIYSIIGLRDELPKERIRATEIFNQAIEIYLKGSETPEKPKSIDELKQAYDLFEEAERIWPEDGSSRCFIERCEDFINNGVPEVWDGVYTMKSK